VVNEIDLSQWRYLLAGGQLSSGMRKPDVIWLGESAWVEVCVYIDVYMFMYIYIYIYIYIYNIYMYPSISPG